jgi:ABC-type nickel/cobalt efflux system permease component RcnA
MRRRVLALAVMVVASFGATAVLAAAPALAHPLGNFTVNRYSGIELTPGHVRVVYALDLAEIPTFQEMPAIDANGDERADAAERQAWADRTAPEILRGLALSVGGRPVSLRVQSDSMELLPGQGGLSILYLRASFVGDVPDRGRLEYADTNDADRIGWKEATARGDGVVLSGSNVPETSPSDELRSYPQDLLTSPLDVTTATLSFSPGAGSAGSAASTAEGTASPAGGGSSGLFAGLVTWKLTPFVALVSMLAAFGFGALHALGPGHGKTIMAAYLVGSGAKLRHSVGVGAAVSLMHTASVLAIGLFALFAASLFPAERIYPWLGLVAGLVVFGLGGALLANRIRARRGGVDPWHGHTHPDDAAPREEVGEAWPRAASRSESAAVAVAAGRVGGARTATAVLDRPGDDHDHDHAHGSHDHYQDGAPRHEAHDHPHDSDRSALSKKGLAALAVSGGILPSPTAVVVLLGAVSLHRIGYGLALIGAFSVGLAAALVGVGAVTMKARSALTGRMGSSRVLAWLPIASAALILGVGCFLTVRAIGQLG